MTIRPADCPWDARQIRTFVREVRDSAGGRKGWSLLGVNLQRMLIEAFVARLLASQLDSVAIYPRNVRALRWAMLNEAAVNDE